MPLGTIEFKWTSLSVSERPYEVPSLQGHKSEGPRGSLRCAFNPRSVSAVSMGGRSLDRHGNRLQWSNDKKFDDTLAWMISHRSGDTCGS
jgi:hypothetical protein